MQTILRLRKTIIIFVVLISSTFTHSLSFGTALNGTYTIGGTSPNYTTFTLAVSDLVSKGVSGPVTFNVRTGTYSEQISITAITGASATNTITFQSESGVNTDVTINYASTADANNYVIQLDGADYIQIKKITIQASGLTTWALGVNFKNAADYNLIDNCKLIGSSATYTTDYDKRALVYSIYSASLNQYNQFTNNTFLYGTYGILFYGNSYTSYAQSLTITNNTFTSILYQGISTQYIEGLSIKQNTIDVTSTLTTSSVGIYIGSSKNAVTIEKNKITSSAYGINLSYTGSSALNGLVANNCIIVSTPAYSALAYLNSGLYISASNLKVYHNSVLVTDPYASALSTYYLIKSYVYNNVLCNTGSGHAVFLSSSYLLTSTKFDYNDIYANGPELVYWESNSNYTNLSDWQATGYDLHSVSVNPSFTSSSDLHTASTSLDGSATPVSDVTTDIDGEVRNAYLPDIGVDEFAVNTDDGALVSIANPVSPFSSGSQTVKVTLMNNGVNTITAAKISWSVNGVAQTDYNWSGSLSSGSSTSVSIGNYTFNVVTGYIVQASISTTNGHTDSKSSNNTITSSTLYPSCNGTYTVGSSADFSSLSTAISYLQTYGVLGAVTLNIKSATYSEQINIPVISSLTSTNTLTIQSETGVNTDVVYSYSGTSIDNNYVIQFDATNYITIKNISLKNNGTTYSTVLNYKNSANYITINNCIITGNVSSGSSFYAALVYSSTASLNQYNQFTNNTFQYGTYGIYYSGKSSSSLASGISITGNTFSNIAYNSVYVKYANAAIVSQNIINAKASTSYYCGIFISNDKNGTKIEKNKITGGYSYGIYITTSSGTSSDYALIDNNFIQVSRGRGIYLSSSCSYIKFYYNSVSLTGISSNSYIPFYFGSSASNLKVYNNIFSNTAGGYTMYSSSTVSITSSTFDYNDYYTSGTNLAFWKGAAVTNLAAWQTATAFDSHSISSNPNFTSSTDLHASASALNNVGYYLSDVTTDIDGTTRSATTPDIGADEFTPSAKNNLASIASIAIEDFSEIKIYPNPASSNATIDLELNNKAFQTEILLVSITGKIIDQIYSGELEVGKHSFNINVNAFSNGIYFVVCKTPSSVYQKKLIISKNN